MAYAEILSMKSWIVYLFKPEKNFWDNQLQNKSLKHRASVWGNEKVLKIIVMSAQHCECS